MSFGDFVTLLRHPDYTEFVAPDDDPNHDGIVLVPDISGNDNSYFGVTSNIPFYFEPGQLIVATFFNRSTLDHIIKAYK